MKAKIRSVLLIGLIWIPGIYLIGICGFFHWFMPRPLPEIQEGDQFFSRVEGFHQRVVCIRNGEVCLESKLMPFASGPPVHIHRHFDEHFTVLRGELQLQLGDSVYHFGPGQGVTIPKGTPHRPFNPGTREVVLLNPEKGTVPLSFARGLAWFYPAMDAEGSADAPGNLLHLALLGPDFDTWLAAKPIPFQWMLRWVLAPVAWWRQ